MDIRIEVTALLLEKGAHIDMQDNNKFSALILASFNGHIEVAALLLEKGAHIGICKIFMFNVSDDNAAP